MEINVEGPPPEDFLLNMLSVCGGKTALVGQTKLAGKSIGKEL